MTNDRTPPYDVVEARNALAGVIAEARAALEHPRFALLVTEKTVVDLYAAAALSHCCELAEQLAARHEAGDELVARLITRALFESWAVGLFIHHGGEMALEALWDDYHHAILKQVEHAERHDGLLQKRRAKAKKANEKIARTNAGIAKWNQQHPDSPKDLLADEAEPPGVKIDYSDWRARLSMFDGRKAVDLPMPALLDRLQELTRDAGDEQTFEAAYVMMFRGLSTVGAHVNLPVLDYYLPATRGLAHVSTRAEPPSSLESADLLSALLLVTQLTQHVLDRRGVAHPAADDVADRMRSAYEQESPAE